MTIQDFCIDNGLPFSTVARHLRAVAASAVVTSADARDAIPTDYGIDVEVDSRSGRFAYYIIDPDRLARKLAHAHGIRSPDLVAVAVQAALELLDLILERSGRRVVGRWGGGVDWNHDFVSELERVELVLGREA